jgi:predicted CopG family antitoxin
MVLSGNKNLGRLREIHANSERKKFSEVLRKLKGARRRKERINLMPNIPPNLPSL